MPPTHEARSRMSSRSNSASAPKMWKMSVPPEVVASMLSVRLRKPISHLVEKPNGHLAVSGKPWMPGPQVVPVIVLPKCLPRSVSLSSVTPSNNPGYVGRTMVGGSRIGAEELTLLVEFKFT